jgi:hypothetical protein
MTRRTCRDGKRDGDGEGDVYGDGMRWRYQEEGGEIKIKQCILNVTKIVTSAPIYGHTGAPCANRKCRTDSLRQEFINYISRIFFRSVR